MLLLMLYIVCVYLIPHNESLIQYHCMQNAPYILHPILLSPHRVQVFLLLVQV